MRRIFQGSGQGDAGLVPPTPGSGSGRMVQPLPALHLGQTVDFHLQRAGNENEGNE